MQSASSHSQRPATRLSPSVLPPEGRAALDRALEVEFSGFASHRAGIARFRKRKVITQKPNIYTHLRLRAGEAEAAAGARGGREWEGAGLLGRSRLGHTGEPVQPDSPPRSQGQRLGMVPTEAKTRKTAMLPRAGRAERRTSGVGVRAAPDAAPRGPGSRLCSTLHPSQSARSASFR